MYIFATLQCQPSERASNLTPVSTFAFLYPVSGEVELNIPSRTN